MTACALLRNARGELFESTGREVVQPGWKVTQEGMEEKEGRGAKKRRNALASA